MTTTNTLEGKRARVPVGTPLRDLRTGKPIDPVLRTSVEYAGIAKCVRNVFCPALDWFQIDDSPLALAQDLTVEGSAKRRYFTDAEDAPNPPFVIVFPKDAALDAQVGRCIHTNGDDCGVTWSLEEMLKLRERELTEAEARAALGDQFPEEQMPPDIEGRTVTLKAGTPIRNTYSGSQLVGLSAERDFSGVARRTHVPTYTGPDIRWYRIYGAEGHETCGYAVLAEDLVEREPDLADRVEAHGFECEAGPLTLCEDWQQLVREYRRLTERSPR